MVFFFSRHNLFFIAKLFFHYLTNHDLIEFIINFDFNFVYDVFTVNQTISRDFTTGSSFPKHKSHKLDLTFLTEIIHYDLRFNLHRTFA